MTNLVRRDPFADLSSRLDRMMEMPFFRPWRMMRDLEELPDVPIEMSESENDIEIKASLPGVKPDDIQVSLQDDTLSIRAEMKQEQKDEQRNYYRSEFQYGSFQRTIGLPAHVKADQAEAKFENGVLRLRLPKSEENKPRQIRVSSGDGHDGGSISYQQGHQQQGGGELGGSQSQNG